MVRSRSQGKLDKKDRRELAKQFITTGHLAAGALLFSQAFSDYKFDLRLAILGACLLGLSYSSAIWLMKGGER